MNRNITKSIAIACGLALTLSAIAAPSFARGSGHTSRSHFGRSNSSFNRGNFGRFASNRFHNFRGRYYGWGYYSPWAYNYGWGWGCYGNSYNSYSNSYYGDNSGYGSSYSGNTEGVTNAGGPPSTPIPPGQNADVAQPPGPPAPAGAGQPAGEPTPAGPGQPGGQPTPAIASATAGPAGTTPANNEEADANAETPTAAAQPTTPAATTPADTAKPAVPPAPADSLVGTFKASPEPGVQIELTMRADTTFTWKFTAQGQSQTFSGLYEVGPKSLTLTRDGGEKMDGTLELVGKTGFKFRMKGAEAADPGLTFSR